MALGTGSLRKSRGAPGLFWGGGALLYLALLSGGAFAGLFIAGFAGDLTGEMAGAAILQIAWFTIYQAVLSTILSVLPAVLVARALSRHRYFYGRSALLKLFAVPLALPPIVAALGILALFGRAGIIAEPLNAFFDTGWPGVYGLSGILIAHVFFNMPLATRLLLAALDTVPDDHWRLSSQLGMGPMAEWRLIEWPVLRNNLPGVASLVLMLCVTSFTIVLTLGGGPAATTLEVAIYQALRFDFDPGRAAILTFIQIALTATLVFLLGRLSGLFGRMSELAISRRQIRRRPGSFESLSNSAIMIVAALFVLGPIAAIVRSGLAADFARLMTEFEVWRAIFTSLVLAAVAAAIAVALSYALVAARKQLETMRGGPGQGMLKWLTGEGSSLILVVPPLVLGAGWFMLLRHFGNVFAWAPVMVITVNAAMAMPFVVRAIRPAHDAFADRHDRLASSLGIRGSTRFRLIDWPVLRVPLMTGFAFAMALSLGDLGVIVLFGSETVQTLPYLLYSRLASYRTSDAAGLALILTLLTLVLMLAASRRPEIIR